MAHCRNLLLHGLSLLLRRPGAVLWIFALSLATAVLFSLPLHSQFAGLLDNSLAAAGLTHGFDLFTAAGVFLRLQRNVPGNFISTASVPVFLLLFFILTPGVLFCYLTNERARLSTLLRQGLLHFWRFVRITILALIAFAVLLGPLIALNNAWASFINERVVGRPGFLLRLLGTLGVFLVASLVRLFFDLVEVYTVQLGLTFRPNGKLDRRVRRAFPPAWRSFRLHFLRTWGGFLLLSLGALLCFSLLSRTAIRTMAQPRAWPLFLFTELAVLCGLAFRLWQRGAQVTLALDHPILTVLETLARSTVVPVPAYVAPAYATVPAAPLTSIADTPPPPPPVVAPSTIPPSSAMRHHMDPEPVVSHTPQPLTPPGDLPPEQVASTAAAAPATTVTPREVPPVSESPAPVHTVYDIDPFTPLPSPPNPLPTEEEERLPGEPRDTPRKD